MSLPPKIRDKKATSVSADTNPFEQWEETKKSEVETKPAPKSGKDKTTPTDNPFEQYFKKKSGTEDGGTGAATTSPTTSVSEAQSSSEENKNRIPDNIKHPFDIAPYNTEIKTSDGTSLIIPKNAVNGTFTDTNYVQELQKRIDNKTVTPDDINNIAAGTGKTANAVTTYLTQGKKIGFAVERMEGQAKTYKTLTNSIINFNKSNGTSYNPLEVLASADKTAAFLNQIKQQPYKEAKANELAAAQQPEIDFRNKMSGRNEKMLPVNPQMPLSLTKEFGDYIKELNNHIVNQTFDEETQKGTPKDQIISRIANLTNPKGVKASMQANLGQIENASSITTNPMAAAGAAYDAIFGTKEKDDLLNSVKGEAELQYNDAVQNKAVNIISEGILIKDDSKIQQGKAMLDSVDQDTIYKYPSLVKQEIARRVSAVIADEAGQSQGSETNNYGIKFAGADTYDYAAVMKGLGYFDNPKTKDLAMSMLQHPEMFADASYFGGMKDNFLQPLKELGMSIGDITQFRNPKDLLSDKKREELFPKEIENAKTLIGNITTRSIFNTTANLAGMTIIAAGTEGIGTELGVSAKAAKSLGAYTSFGLPSYDAALKDSYNFLDNDAARTLYATISAVTNAEGGRLLDLGKVVRIPGVSEVYAKMATKLTEGDVSKKLVGEMLGEAKNKYIDFAVKYGKNVTKGAATMAYFNISNNIERLAFGDPTIKAKDILPQAAHAFIDGVTGMSIMGAFGAVSDMRNEKNTSYKGFIYNMALNHDSVEDIFKQGLKDGTYTQADFNQKMQILNTAMVAKNAMDAAQSETNVVLNENQKSVYVANKTAAAILRNKIENEPKKISGGSEGDKPNEMQQQVKRLEQQNKDVLEGLKFTPTLEPLYDLFEAEKEYNEAQADGNYDKIEKSKLKYDNLVNQYLNNEQDKNKITEGKDTKSEDAQKQEAENTEAKVSLDFKGLRDDDFATKYFTPEEYKKWSDVEKDNPEAAKQMVADKKEGLKNNPIDEKLTEEQIKEWSNLSMQEKLKLAKENLPEIEKLSDHEAAKVADKNAKILLDKLHGIETKDISSSKTTDNGESNKKEGDKEADAQKGKESDGKENAPRLLSQEGSVSIPKEAEPLLEQARGLVENIKSKEFDIAPLKEAAKNSPEDFYKFMENIAEQTDDPRSRDKALGKYGEDLVNISHELFPQENTEKYKEVKKLETEKEAKVKEETKPDVKMEFIKTEDLVNSKDPLGNKEEHDRIKENFKKIKSLLDCING